MEVDYSLVSIMLQSGASATTIYIVEEQNLWNMGSFSLLGRCILLIMSYDHNWWFMMVLLGKLQSP